MKAADGHVAVMKKLLALLFVAACMSRTGLVFAEEDSGNAEQLAQAVWKASGGENWPDVKAIVHSHSPTVIPFGISDVPLRPVFHLGAFLVGAPDIDNCLVPHFLQFRDRLDLRRAAARNGRVYPRERRDAGDLLLRHLLPGDGGSRQHQHHQAGELKETKRHRREYMPLASILSRVNRTLVQRV